MIYFVQPTAGGPTDLFGDPFLHDGVLPDQGD